jgi:hypothetical protein
MAAVIVDWLCVAALETRRSCNKSHREIITVDSYLIGASQEKIKLRCPP